MPGNAPKEDLLQETLASERSRVTVQAGVFAACALIVPLFPLLLRDDPRAWRGALAIFVVLALACGYQIWLRHILGRLARERRRPPDAVRYANALADTATASVMFFGIGHAFGAGNPIAAAMPLAYFVFVILSALRLHDRICLFTGAAAAAQCLFVHLLLGHTSGSALGGAALEAFLLLVGGALAAFVTRQIRVRAERSISLVRERNQIVSVFGQHVSPAVVEHLLSHPAGASGELRRVCVMFLDIRNFTTFSEKRAPDEVVSYLNALFEQMIEIVNRHGGIINKFLGDGFMAVFGAPIADPQDCAHALAAAREILASVERQVASGAIPPTRVGMGLHVGEALTGTIGAAARREYTIIGDVVNLASRIESLNKQFGAQLLISEAVAAQVSGEAMSSLGPVTVKGREAPIEIFKIA